MLPAVVVAVNTLLSARLQAPEAMAAEALAVRDSLMAERMLLLLTSMEVAEAVEELSVVQVVPVPVVLS
jgi:hypothetical protein